MLVWSLAILPIVAGCRSPYGNALPAAASTASVSASSSPTSTMAITAQAVRFTTPDGVALAGALYGRGAEAIILSNEGDNNSAPWQPVARQLAAAGYLVLSYAYRPRGATYDGLAAHALSDLHAAIAFMRSRSIRKLLLVGGSLGALESLKAATTAPCDGLVAISSPVGYQDVQLSDAELRSLTVPKLFVTSADNQPFAGDTLHMFDVSAQPKDKRVYPGDAHGVSLFSGASGANLLAAILSFAWRYAPVA
jgi:pimeloyl-ACP methyl ester carboxylesterase